MFPELTRTFVFKVVAPCSFVRLLYRQNTIRSCQGPTGLHERPLLRPPPPRPTCSIACCVQGPGSFPLQDHCACNILCLECSSPDVCTSFISNVMSKRPSLNTHLPQVKHPIPLPLCPPFPLSSTSLFMALGVI